MINIKANTEEYSIEQGTNTGLFMVPSREDLETTSNESKSFVAPKNRKITPLFRIRDSKSIERIGTATTVASRFSGMISNAKK